MNGGTSELSRAAVEALPKVELHVHLDCCLSWRAVSTLEPGIDRESYRCNRDALAAAFLGEKDRWALQDKLEAGYAPWLKREEAL